MTIRKQGVWLEERYFGGCEEVSRLLVGKAQSHPEGRRYAPDKVADIDHIKLEISFDIPRKKIMGICTTSLAPIGTTVDRLVMDCMELTVDSVKDGRGKGLAFHHDGERLEIQFKAQLPADELTDIVVAYHGHPRVGLYFTGPDEFHPDKAVQIWTQGEDEDSRYWFPCFDYPNEKASSETITTVPEGWTVVGNGEMISAKHNKRAKTRTFHYREEIPHANYLISLACGEFVKILDEWDGIPVEYFVKPGLEEKARRSFKNTPDMLACFSDRFGYRYPYKKYAQVVVEDFIFGGMENIGATTLIDRVLVDDRGALDYEPDDLISHELAHQWFGDLVTCKDWSHAWLNEGFATYSEVVYREHWKGGDDAHYHRHRAAQSYLLRDRIERRPVVTKDYTYPMELFDQHIYEKGSCVVHMLRHVLGEEDYWRVIREYLQAFAGKTVQTVDLITTITRVTGKNLEWFFDQWLYGTGYPEYEVTYAYDGTQGVATLRVDQKQKVENKTPLFRMPVTLSFHGKNGPIQSSVLVNKSHHVFHVKLDEAPLFVRFDPGSHILKSLNFKKPPAMLKTQLEKDPDFFGRIEAAQGLCREGSVDSLNAVGRHLPKETFWAVQAEMASALGENGSLLARDLLIRHLKKMSHPKARRTVVAALGRFRDPKAAKALRPFAEKDPSCFVEAQAALSLGSTLQKGAFEIIEKAVARDSDLDVIREYALAGLSRLRDDRAIPILKQYAAPGPTFRARGAAMAGLARLCKGRDGIKDDARIEIEQYTSDSDYFAKLQAMSALEALGETAALPEIQRLANREADARMKITARDVSLSLRKGKTRGEEVNALRKDLEKLQNHNRSLADRIEKLEASLPKAKQPEKKKKPRKGKKN